jgi:hypothetical protein
LAVYPGGKEGSDENGHDAGTIKKEKQQSRPRPVKPMMSHPWLVLRLK